MAQNTKHVILERRAKIAELHAKGLRQWEIAVAVGVTQQQVSKDIKRIREVWLESAVEHVAEVQAIQLAKLEQVEREAWEAWERSKQSYTKTQVKRAAWKGEKRGKGLKQRPDVERTDVEVLQFGNPAYLNAVMNCVQKRIEIFGLKAPEKAEVKKEVFIGSASSDEGNPFDKLSDDQLAQLADIAEIIEGEEKRSSD